MVFKESRHASTLIHGRLTRFPHWSHAMISGVSFWTSTLPPHALQYHISIYTTTAAGERSW